VSDDLLQHCKVQIGDSRQWLSVSDHMPMSLDINAAA
jgi:endonuclease/exonuclease/phosphatase family metal-dependent hydrolase